MQIYPTECGLVSAAALLAVKGFSVQVSDIRRHAGDGCRGLTIRQVRDVLRTCGGTSEAVLFDPSRVESVPVPSILLLERGHYIVVARRRRGRLTVFYPEFGWTKVEFSSLKEGLSPYAIVLEQVDTSRLPAMEQKPARAVLLAAVKAHPLRLVGLYALFVVLTQALLLALPAITGTLVDAAKTSARLQSFGGAIVVYALVSGITSLISSGGLYVSQMISKAAGLKAGAYVFAALGRKRARWFESLPADGVRNAIASIDSLVRMVSASATTTLTALTSLVIASVVLWTLSPWLIAICLPLVAISGLIDSVAERNLTQAAVRLFEFGQRRNRFVGDALAQFPLFERMGRLGALEAKYIETLRLAVDSDAAMTLKRSAKSSVISLVRAFDLLLFSYLASMLMKNDMLSLGGFVAGGAYKVALTQAIASLVQQYGQFKAAAPNLRQASDLVTSEREPRSDSGPVGEPAETIVFEGVGFRYGPFDQPVLTEINLSMLGGEFAVIAGASGCGKTTIAKLVSGAEAPNSGQIAVRGQSPSPGMAGVSLVLQTDRLVEGTISENVSLFDETIDAEEIWQALRLVRLDDFVRSLPMGLLTRVGEGRGGISAGQRQRVLLARAVLGGPSVLVLDEATSNLDIETEAKILSSLRATGATILLIAHRPEAWSGADKIYDLVDGVLQLRRGQGAGPAKVNGRRREVSV